MTHSVRQLIDDRSVCRKALASRGYKHIIEVIYVVLKFFFYCFMQYTIPILYQDLVEIAHIKNNMLRCSCLLYPFS